MRDCLKKISALVVLSLCLGSYLNAQSGFPDTVRPAANRDALPLPADANPAARSPYAPQGFTDTSTAAVATDRSRKLQAGDTITYEIDEDKVFDPTAGPVEQTIGPSGEISVYPFGGIDIAGLSANSAEAKIKSALEREYYKRATVRVVLKSIPLSMSGTASPLGSVNVSGKIRPGRIPIRPGMKVDDVILEAGDINQFGDSKKIELIRQEGGTMKKYIVDLKAIRSGDDRTNYPVKPGDRINVPARGITFFGN